MKRLVKIAAFAAFTLVIGYLLLKIGSVTYTRYLVRLQIENLEAKTTELTARNDQILSLLEQLDSKEYLLLKAKEEFNLKESGESVASIVNEKEADGKEESKERATYLQEWWKFFFGPDERE